MMMSCEVKRSGNSKVIVVTPVVLDYLDVSDGDVVQVDFIKKIEGRGDSVGSG